VLAAGTGFTDCFIRRGRYPGFKGPLPFTPGYELVGIIEKTGSGVTALREGQLVADLCVIGGYAQYAIRPARFLVPVPDGVDATFDAIGGAHFDRSFACLASGGLLVGYGSQTMAVGSEGLLSAGLGLARLKLWGSLGFLFGGRHAAWYSITDRRLTHPEEF